jgi:recombination protein RecA
MGVANNMIDKSGAWYSYCGERIGQGKDNVRLFLKEHPDMTNEIDAKLRAKMLTAMVKTSSSGEAEEMEEA